MFKKIIKHYSVDTFSLWAISGVAEGMVFEEGTRTLLLAGVGVTAVSLFAKPVINLLLFPLNLVTFGIFRWVSSAIVLYVVSLLVKGFGISFFKYGGFTSKWIDIHALHFNGVLSFIAFSFLFSLFASVVYWIVK